MIILQVTKEELADTIEKAVAKVIASGKNKELEERLLSTEEACKLFQPRISRTTLYNWEREGLIQKHTIGRSVFYKYSEIMASLQTLKRYKTAS